MSVFVYGLSHQNTPLEKREKLFFDQEVLPVALRQAREHLGVSEVVLLSTCNRVEVYCSHAPSLNPAESRKKLSQWLTGFHQLDQCVDSMAYCYTHEQAVRHLIRVASGLDSLILGEPQIMGQVKTAFHIALQAGTTRAVLNQLGQHSIAAAKHIRSTTRIGENPVTLAYATLKLAKKVIGNIEESQIIFIGAGEITELVARYFINAGAGEVLIANRTPYRAQELAHNLQVQIISLSKLRQHLPGGDIVISSTGSPTPIVGKGMVETALEKRQKPFLMVDLAVPRDIEPEVGRLENVHLYSIDDLRDIVESSRRNRADEALLAEDIASNEAIHFMDYLKGRDATSVIKRLRSQAENAATRELARARARLARGEDPNQIMKDLAHTLTSKWLHHPTVMLRQAGSADHSELLDAVCYLHQLHLSSPGERNIHDSIRSEKA